MPSCHPSLRSFLRLCFLGDALLMGSGGGGFPSWFALATSFTHERRSPQLFHPWEVVVWKSHQFSEVLTCCGIHRFWFSCGHPDQNFKGLLD